MTQQTPPGLDQYPGYFPAAKPPFWTRAKVGAATGIVGLLIGLAAAPGNADPAPSADKTHSAPAPSAADIQAKVDDAVAAAEGRMNSKLATVRDHSQQRLTTARSQAAAAQRRAVSRAVAHAHAQDHAKLVQAVATAKASVQTAAPPAAPSAPAAPATDPRFSYCYEANDAGYGPYFRGQDPEYYWYTDADNDGEVCE